MNGRPSPATADAAAPTGDSVLRRRLRAAADPSGYLPFDRYMEMVLYDPGQGFYDRSGTRLGRAGDFYTAAHVHRLFGDTLAAHLCDLRGRTPYAGRWSLVEVGPGDGTLAVDILQALAAAGERGGDWEYILVERSPALQAQAGQRLSAAGVPFPWRFSSSLAALGPVSGVVLANELLDALPVRRLQRTPEGWAELGVSVPETGALAWATRPVEPDALPSDLPSAAAPGTVLEISPTTDAWMREVSDHLARGYAIVIDYGDQESALLSRAPLGTLEAIRSHQPVDPLSRPGTADLSCWVNFSRTRRAAEAAGLRQVSYGPLRTALVDWGLDRVRLQEAAGADPVEVVKLQLAQKSFLLGFENFQVLELEPLSSHVGGGENRS